MLFSNVTQTLYYIILTPSRRSARLFLQEFWTVLWQCINISSPLPLIIKVLNHSITQIKSFHLLYVLTHFQKFKNLKFKNK